MKKWTNPEVMILGVENTMADECNLIMPLDKDAPVQHHPCHLENQHSSSQHNGDSSVGRKHWISEECADGHEYCCCYGLS